MKIGDKVFVLEFANNNDVVVHPNQGTIVREVETRLHGNIPGQRVGPNNPLVEGWKLTFPGYDGDYDYPKKIVFRTRQEAEEEAKQEQTRQQNGNGFLQTGGGKVYFSHLVYFDAYVNDGNATLPSRKSQNMTHSLVVLSSKSLSSLIAIGEQMKVKVLSFARLGVSSYDDVIMYGEDGKKETKFYRLHEWFEDKLFKEEPILGEENIEDGSGEIEGKDISIDKLVKIAKGKWSKIEYKKTTARDKNCIGFSDDFIYYLKHGTWNPRIQKCHNTRPPVSKKRKAETEAGEGLNTDYSQGKIYKIKSPHTKNVYIGSTTLDLNVRLQKHKEAYKLFTKNHFGRYCSSFEIVKHPDAYIELVEPYNGKNLISLLDREREIMKNTRNCINQRSY